MALLLLGVAALCWWGWRTRDAQAMRIGDVAAVVAALIGLRLMSRGAEAQALAALAGAGWWLWWRRGGRLGRTAPDMSPDEARRLLDLAPGADAAEVRAAHRRLIARVHPDVGGSADLTARVNAARDALLGRRIDS